MSTIQDIMSQGWVGTVLGLAGIVVAIAIYIRSRRKARLALQSDHVTLIGGGGAAFPNEVEIRFAGTVVPRLTASTIRIWNCGNLTVNGTDMAEADPLRVEVPEAGHMLRHAILRQSRSVNGWAVDQQSPNRLDLRFDYLDPGDGVKLGILHSEAGGQLAVAGTFKGIPRGLLVYGGTRRSFYRSLSALTRHGGPRVILWIGLGTGILATIVGVFLPLVQPWIESLDSGEPTDPRVLRWSLILGGALYALLPGVILWRYRRRYPAILDSTGEAKVTKRDEAD